MTAPIESDPEALFARPAVAITRRAVGTTVLSCPMAGAACTLHRRVSGALGRRRAVLARRSECVAMLYRPPFAASVVALPLDAG